MGDNKGNGFSRRDFIKNTAAGVVGVMAVGVLGGCASSSKVKESTWDKETDVLIVGGGGTGLAAAVEAAAAGASVLILEKTEKAGGSTGLSGGVMQAAGTEVQKQLSSYKDDTPEKHYQLWLKAAEGYADENLIKDLAYGAPDHINWLTQLGLKFTSIYGHCHIPYVDSSLMADRIHVYEGGGAGGGGVILINKLLEAAQGKGAKIEYKIEATKLLTDDNGEVSGVEAKQDGKNLRIKAHKGVILATASIDMNKEMAKELSPQQYWDIDSQTCVISPTNTGDGIRMGMELGAAVCGFGGTIDFCGKTGAATDNRNPVFPSFIVNKAGRRFVCEDATYAYHYRAIFQQEKQLNGPTYMIFGKSSLIKGAPWTEESVAKDVASGAVFTADTIEELAAKIGVEAANLKAALEQWNNDVNTFKADKQFGRLTGLAAITGPFYAYKNVSYNLGSLGGLKINTDTQVLDAKGEPIPRLYAGGLNAGGWLGPYYPGSGTAIIGTIHWGRKAGANAAKLESLA